MADHDAGDGAADEEWRFPLSEFDDDDGDPGGAVDRDPDVEEEPEATIEAGDPSLEGAVFLLLGIGFALFVVSRLVAG